MEIESSHTGFNKRFRVTVVFALLLSCYSVGCLTLISEYDLHTYKNLTELKGEMRITFEKFAKNGASGESDQKKLDTFWIQISQALEYEKGKNLNNDTTAQFEILDETIREVIERFESGGLKLSAGYSKAKWRILDRAFVIAIETERNKINKK